MEGAGGAAERFVDLVGSRGLHHQPSLDGLRGIALLMVLAYHSGASWAVPGFVGLSLFFSLSGFLIGTQLLVETDRDGGISLSSFYTRRVKRLLPMMALTLIAIAVVWTIRGAMTASLRHSMGWAALYGANWNFIASGQSYGGLFQSGSPVTHLWSLSIEEQFYLLLPLLWAGVVRSGSRDYRRSVLAVVMGVAVASVATTWLSQPGPDRVYYGTDTRAGELCLGIALAVLLSRRDLRKALVDQPALHQAVNIGGAAVLLGMVALGTVGHGSEFMTRGGFGVLACGAAVVVVSSLTPRTILHRVFSLRWLGLFGRVSYGWYLLHWPILVLLVGAQRPIDRPARYLAGLALSFMLALLAHRKIEVPVSRVRGIRFPQAAAFAVCSAVIGLVVVSSAGTSTLADQLEQRREDALLRSSRRARSEAGSGPVVSMFGDSIAMTLWLMINGNSNADERFYSRGRSVTELGCGVVRGGQLDLGSLEPSRAVCDQWPTRWPDAVRTSRSTVAVVLSCGWDQVNRVLPGQESLRSFSGGDLDSAILDEYRLAVGSLVAAGVRQVLWMTCPHYDPRYFEARMPDYQREVRSDASVDRLNGLIRSLHTEPAVSVVELGPLVDGLGDDPALRPDGAHFDPALGSEFDRRVNELIAAAIPTSGAQRIGP